MSSKEELYRVLIDSAPYGTLFVVYGVCIDANTKAYEQLDCEKKQLIGTSLDEISGEESTFLIDLKLRLKKALKQGEKSFEWLKPGCSTPTKVKLLLVNGSEKEIVVTLEEAENKPATSAPLTADKPEVQRYGGEPEKLAVTREAIPPAEQNEGLLTSEPQQSSGALRDEDARESPRVFHDNYSLGSHSSLDSDMDKVAGTPSQRQESSPLRSSVKYPEEQSGVVKSSSPSTTGAAPVSSTRELFFDKMTGLPNRQLLLKKVEEYLKVNQGKEICGLLMMMDLDHFKDVNNSWGHAAGDKLLKKIGRALAGTVKGENLLARLSGDEFVLFVPRVSASVANAAWEAQAVAEKVREIIAAPQILDGHEVYLTASIGIALLTDPGVSAERGLQFADTATYEAKRKGRNGIAFFDPSLTEKAHRDVDLSNRLRRALDNQEFVLFIQPQLSVETGDLVGGEVLLRWMSADRVTSMPSEFIPLLEKSGLIIDVGRWVIRTSCEYLRNLIDDGLWRPHMKLGVNISPRQFHDPQLLDVIEHSVQSYNVDPRYLNFEITENLVIEDVDDAILKMEQIKSLGSRFSIDDFGIGYSSMIYLKRLPLDCLKIDREFIRNIHTDSDSRGVVEAIMAVSKQYGLQVTAEGVENGESLDVVRRLGCNSYQGAHYSMPVPYSRFKRMLAA